MEPTCVLTTEERFLRIRDLLLLLLCPRAEKKRVEGTVSELFRLGQEPVGGKVFVRETRMCFGGKMMVGDLLNEVLCEGEEVITHSNQTKLCHFIDQQFHDFFSFIIF